MENINYDKCVDLYYPVGQILRPLRSYHILKYFGVGGKNGNGPIPPSYNAVKQIGDTVVAILPQGTELHSRRVVAQCKHCLRWVCAGHLDQHQRGRRCSENPPVKVRYLK